MNHFFEDETNLRVISTFINRINGVTYETEFEENRSGFLLVICNSIKNNPSIWDQRCQINIEWIGEHFIQFLSERVQSINKDNLDTILGMLFRFLLEYHLSTANNMHRDLERAKIFCTENVELFVGEAKDDIQFALSEMPIAILKKIANSPAIDSIRNLHSASTQFEKTKQQWDNELQKREDKASKLKESLDNYKDAFNFVGLSEGFNHLANAKRKEMADVLMWLRVVAILIVCPLLTEIVYILFHLGDLDKLTKIMLLVALPTISLMAILIYYFRVLLSNYKSIQSQLLQIDLRMTLCRFIHNYSEYASNMKKQDGNSLDKFESVIFSGITSSPENIPSTFDGVEQLSKLIRAVKP